MPESRLRVLSIFGTRPEAVKMAPVIAELNATAGVESLICVTAQHRQMLDQVLELFDIQPDYDLNLMQHDQALAELTASVLTDLDPVYREVKPDWILIQGDTTTVMAAALLAYYHQIKVGHVEAGLRTGNKWQPFPEEINRRVAGTVTDLHFAPTNQARDNLLREAVPDEQIVVTGNPVIDALHSIIDRPYDFDEGPLAEVPWERRIILVTAHRRENFGQPLEDILSALGQIMKNYADDLHMVYPVHMNPNVQEPVHRHLGNKANITLMEPLDYQPMVHLMKRAYLVLTDSGGLQEEAPALGTPVLVLREMTERPEVIETGTALLVGSDPERIVAEATRLLEDQEAYKAMARAVHPYGEGQAAAKIVAALLEASSPSDRHSGV
jgi:UDP-N-acetylglucosamine 2-epimerase (non-hydrolysing)